MPPAITNASRAQRPLRGIQASSSITYSGRAGTAGNGQACRLQPAPVYRAEIMAELPRWVSTRAQELKVQKPARLELRRSLEMHRWPALGVTLAGVVLAAIYLVTLWPSETSSTQLAGVIVCATGILTISIVLGASVAIVAHNSDQRIYIGADIENLLGVSPLVQLPDLSEASTEAAQQKLICLAKGIAEVCTEGSVRRCVFTGTGVGAGVSTVAAKTKETLREIGRAALLVDAAWATPGAGPGIGNTQDEGASESNGLILTDTAPLAESPDTEFLTRFADCVIVVVESGVTTREQLRNTANCLQRLNVAAVGFVLNRVRQARSGLTLRYLLRTESCLQFSSRTCTFSPKWCVLLIWQSCLLRMIYMVPPE